MDAEDMDKMVILTGFFAELTEEEAKKIYEDLWKEIGFEVNHEVVQAIYEQIKDQK